MNGWLIYSSIDALDNESYIKWFINEASLQSIRLELILREDLTIGIINNNHTVLLNNKVVKLPTFAVVRTIEPLLNRHLEEIGIKTFNSSSVSYLANHKANTHYQMNLLEVPMVDTLFIQKENLTNEMPLSLPFVVKEATGRGGKQVYFIQDRSDWENCLNQLKSSDLVIQSTDVKMGKDVRVYVIGKDIIGAVIRESATDFRSNFKLGGTATWYPLNNNELNLINKIIHAFDFDMVGIDFLIDQNEDFLFNEIEDVVGSRMLSAVSEINLLKKYITHIKAKCH